jgi:uncharacterized protein with FMN-binding domain
MAIIKRRLHKTAPGAFFSVLVCLALLGCPHQGADNTPEAKPPQEELPAEETPEEEGTEEEGTEEETPGRFHPGTYSGQAAGFGGPLSVTAAFSADSIDRVVITSHSETASRPAVRTALTAIPRAIVDGQSLAVDGVSGATLTSSAIKNAVETCVIQAGGGS